MISTIINKDNNDNNNNKYYYYTSREARRRSLGWSPSIRVKMAMYTHFL